jgi:pimeloyl-ACP methyl ester carboxylesterase
MNGIEGLAFPRGYFQFHEHPSINYQLNRLLPTAALEEVKAAGRQVADLAAWKRQMLALGTRAEAEGRHLHASTYFRAAEFYMLPGDPDKEAANGKFLELFAAATEDLPLERLEVPYRHGALPVIRLPADGSRRDVLLVHGGFDSYIEELVFAYLDFPEHGIEVILFEGPGQGQALRRHGLTMDPAWEQPVTAVLDHFGIGECTLMGLSLGGYLAPRAAAFEPRVKRVIVNDVLTDFLDCFAHDGNDADPATMIDALLSQDRLDEIDRLATSLMNADEVVAWVIRHGMAVCGAERPAGFFQWLTRIKTAPFSDRLTQDVLLMAAAEDHIVPLHQWFDQARTLTNVASLTAQLFTKADCAQSHCHVGNLPLAQACIRSWIELQLRTAGERQGVQE